ncbi:MAG: hypothetical protein IJ049_05805 [Oscillospiraceae bacterium]|nr:hypothetical protein [Oscillospiraceae bacterium]
MNKIINGKKYSTTTAEELASYSNMYDFRNFDYFSETLYRKKSGEFFLYGEGGALTKYAKTVGQNEWSGGHEIIPLSIAEAKEWAAEHLDGDVYEDIFGPVEE